jgi:hypothetical protein
MRKPKQVQNRNGWRDRAGAYTVNCHHCGKGGMVQRVELGSSIPASLPVIWLRTPPWWFVSFVATSNVVFYRCPACCHDVGERKCVRGAPKTQRSNAGPDARDIENVVAAVTTELVAIAADGDESWDSKRAAVRRQRGM